MAKDDRVAVSIPVHLNEYEDAEGQFHPYLSYPDAVMAAYENPPAPARDSFNKKAARPAPIRDDFNMTAAQEWDMMQIEKEEQERQIRARFESYKDAGKSRDIEAEHTEDRETEQIRTRFQSYKDAGQSRDRDMGR